MCFGSQQQKGIIFFSLQISHIFLALAVAKAACYDFPLLVGVKPQKDLGRNILLISIFMKMFTSSCALPFSCYRP
jgi:hypothetical protein